MNARDFTARGRALGAELRAWRERAGLEGTEMARRLSWSPTKVCNIESGRRGVSEVDAAMYLACCRTPGDDIKRVLEFFHENADYWVDLHGTHMSDELRSLATLESSASAIQSFECSYIPGLLQTEDYTRALITDAGLVPREVIEPRVGMRKDRQALLRGYRPPQTVFFIHENALRLPVGNDAVMNDQLLHLVFASSRPHISLRVVPTKAGARGAARAFVLLGYSKAKPLVYLEHDAASLFLDGSRYVDSYRDNMSRLASAALDEDESRRWLAELANEHDRPPKDAGVVAARNSTSTGGEPSTSPPAHGIRS
jgi:transcriptional regulator with XRE-family HTH domain